MKKIVFLAIALLLPLVVFSQTAEEYFKKGEEYYRSKDFQNALLYYKKAAEMNHSKAMYNIGDLYSSGKGVVKDKQEAFKWYKRGAEAGDSYAQYQLAKFYCEGRSVNPDAAECYAWLLAVQNAQDPVLNGLTQQAIAAVRANATPLELERGEAKMSGRENPEKKDSKVEQVLDFL